jgi:hypothetical protein
MRHFLPTRRLAAAAAILAAALLPACTDLAESPTSAITPDNYYSTDAQILGGLSGVYATLRDGMWWYFNLSSISTDELVVPTRGQDWFDNGRWLEIHRQGWTPVSGAALEDINGAYNGLSAGISRANAVLNTSVMNDPNLSATRKSMKAEARALRAWYYFMMLDFFGGVPIVTDTKVEARPRNSALEVFTFIEKEWKEVLVDLPDTWDAGNYGRLTKGSVNAMLASLYLNAQVLSGETTASGLTRGPAKWTEANQAADAVINSGRFTLQSTANWIKNFAADNATAPNNSENIFVVRHKAQDGLGMSLQMRGSHYNQPAGGWNGFTALPQVYTQYDSVTNGGDIRRQTVRVGQQFALDGVTKVKDRAGADLIFSLTIPNITTATENQGARLEKFGFDPSNTGGNFGNDFTYFRLAEMFLIKAEALNELGQTPAAITALNVVKARARATPMPAGASQAQVRAELLVERQRELAGEAKRRQDTNRFGTFTNPSFYKTVAGAPYKVRFPIPNPQLQTNPLLKQNPGY